MTRTLYLVVAGNIIDEYNKKNENTDNVVEIFDNPEAAEIFGSLFDFYLVKVKQLRSTGFMDIEAQNS